jgi:hypothetical protein
MHDEELIALEKSGNMSLILRQNWKERTGIDPILKLQEDSRRNTRLGLCMFIGLILLFGLLILGFIGIFIFNIKEEFFCVGGACAGLILLSVTHLVGLTHQSAVSMNEVGNFSKSLSSFLEWSGETSQSLSKMNMAELKATAFKILVEEAKKIVVFDRTAENIPSELRKVNKRELMDSFKGKHLYCELLGLAGGPYNKYFDRATSELDGELKQLDR